MTNDLAGAGDTRGMVRVEHSDPIDVSSWNLFGNADDVPNFITSVEHHVSEVLRKQLEETPPELWFPCQWSEDDGIGGKCPDDLATIYLTLPLGAEEGTNVCWSISLQTLIDDIIDGYVVSSETPGRGILDATGREICDKLAVRLRELAARLEETEFDLEVR